MTAIDIADPIDFLARAHENQLEICRLLEQIADALPDRVDRLQCFHAASLLRLELAFHQADEELGLFPLLRRHCADNPDLRCSLDRLEREHVDDEGFADEIIEALDDMARGVAPRDTEAFAYMLRGFFACFRRHIAFETEIVLPAARRCLDADMKAKLAAVMRANRSQDVTRLFPHSPCVSAKAALLRALGARVESSAGA